MSRLKFKPMEEVEVKFLNIDPIELKNKLNSLGDKKIFDRVYRRKPFDYWKSGKKVV